METFDNILPRAAQIRDAQTDKENTAERVGGVLVDLVQAVDEAVKTVEHPISVQDIDNADLIVADEDENPIVTFANGHIKTANFDSSNIRTELPIEVKDAGRADLVLADENENPIATFIGGHIRTANFDSSNFSMPRPLAGKKLSILGDSISTYAGFIPDGYNPYYPNGDIQQVELTWWRQVLEETGMNLLKNASSGGTTVCGPSQGASSTAGCSDARVSALAAGSTKPDIIIVWMGINDWGTLDAQLGNWTSRSEIVAEGIINNFSSAYALMLKKIMLAYPSAKVYCCTLLENRYTAYQNASSATYPRHATSGQTIDEYNQRIKEIATAMGARIIDTHECGITYWSSGTYLIDALHPNAAGARLIADYIINKLNN